MTTRGRGHLGKDSLNLSEYEFDITKHRNLRTKNWDHATRSGIRTFFLCPHLPLAGVEHIAFRRDVMSVLAYVRMSRS